MSYSYRRRDFTPRSPACLPDTTSLAFKILFALYAIQWTGIRFIAVPYFGSH